MRRLVLFSLEFLAMVSAIVFLVGCLLGAVISRKWVPPGQKKDLEQSLQLTRQELNQYQQDVAQHFAETSRLVHTLTQSYKDVHEHLAHGAIKLTNAEIGQQMLAAGENKLRREASELVEELRPEPPRDWAPKIPGEKGALSEDYRLNEDETEEAPINLASSLHGAKTGS